MCPLKQKGDFWVTLNLLYLPLLYNRLCAVYDIYTAWECFYLVCVLGPQDFYAANAVNCPTILSVCNYIFNGSVVLDNVSECDSFYLL